MKKTIAIGVTLILGVCIVMSIITPAHAQGQTVFGPEEMIIDKWFIHLSFHQFSADNPGEGVLFVTKNTPEELIKGGFVLLNDQVIALREFLQGDEIVFEREVFSRLDFIFFWINFSFSTFLHYYIIFFFARLNSINITISKFFQEYSQPCCACTHDKYFLVSES